MKILYAAAEVYPLAKVGGLGDVAGSLPKALKALGHDVRIVMPRYGMVKDVGEELGSIRVPADGATDAVSLRKTAVGEVPVYLIDYPPLFDRPKVYEYKDDGQRFGVFCRAILDMLPAVDFTPDVIHLNDWHTSLVAAFLKTTYKGDERYEAIKTVLTVHNAEPQGIFGREVFDRLGLPAEMWNPDGVEFYGQLNCLKAGVMYADLINAVSPTYAREIQSEAYGFGLDGLLRSRSAKLTGILNGIDYDVWNPAKDPFIQQRYSKSTIDRKARDKEALQKEAALEVDARAPLLGIVSRVTTQKGFEILIPTLPDILQMGAQLMLLGTGEKRYEEPLGELARTHPGFVAFLKYDEALAHRIYAGSDFFLMPSKFEPCGLGQMISLRYGTIPIVRSTGGLADTVTDASADPKQWNGFVFRDFTPSALLDAVRRAIDFHRKRRGWKTLQMRAMASDLSWGASARKYIALYKQTVRG